MFLTSSIILLLKGDFKLKIDKKTKIEQLFVLVVIFLGSIITLGLTGCSGSCLACNYGCESDENYTLFGLYTCSPFSWDCNSCKTTSGCINFSGSEIAISNVDVQIDGCMNGCLGENCYNSCYMALGDDCGDFGITFGCADSTYIGYTDVVDTCESTFGCVDGQIGCADNNNVYELIMEIHQILGELED